MAASCAVCLAPIVANDPFALCGTEVVHQRCAPALTSRGTIGTKTRQKVVELQREVDRLRGVETYQARASAELHSERRTNENNIASARRNEAEYRRQRDDMRRERDDAIAARDAARSLLQLRETLDAQVPRTPAAPATPAPTEPANDDRDSTAVRFSLLELD